MMNIQLVPILIITYVVMYTATMALGVHMFKDDDTRTINYISLIFVTIAALFGPVGLPLLLLIYLAMCINKFILRKFNVKETYDDDY